MGIKVGAHVSVAGSLDQAIDRAFCVGADCVQIFGSAPQRWQFLLFPKEQISLFRKKAKEHKIAPNFVHGIYLVNLASSSSYILKKSITSLSQYLDFSALIGALGVVLHVGSHKGRGWRSVREQVFGAVGEVLASVPSSQALILENSAGAGGIIGADFSELGEIVKAVDDSRVKVCLDTAHAFESGYALSPVKALVSLGKTGSLGETLDRFDKEIGLERLILIHANDSKTPFASGVDRHEDLGKGFIGREGFREIASHPFLKNLPFIIETPRSKGQCADKENISFLKEISP
jgi:deoxyribonuclease-4